MNRAFAGAGFPLRGFGFGFGFSTSSAAVTSGMSGWTGGFLALRFRLAPARRILVGSLDSIRAGIMVVSPTSGASGASDSLVTAAEAVVVVVVEMVVAFATEVSAAAVWRFKNGVMLNSEVFGGVLRGRLAESSRSSIVKVEARFLEFWAGSLVAVDAVAEDVLVFAGAGAEAAEAFKAASLFRVLSSFDSRTSCLVSQSSFDLARSFSAFSRPFVSLRSAALRSATSWDLRLPSFSVSVAADSLAFLRAACVFSSSERRVIISC